MDDENPLEPQLESRSARLAYAVIEARGLWEPGTPSLLEALAPGTKVSQGEDKEWLMARTRLVGGIIFGRIGFERVGDEPDWDPETLDFGTRRVEHLQVSPYAIDPETLQLAYQVRAPQISAAAFIKALQALMNEASPLPRWRVSRIERDESYAEWRGRAKRVSKVRVKVRRPNPHYDFKPVEDLVEDLNAKVATLSAAADPDDPQGIDTDDEFLNQMISHATERNGEFSAVGTDAKDRPISYSSKSKTAEKTVAADPVTGEVPADVLRNEVQADTDYEEATVPANPPPPRQHADDPDAQESEGELDRENEPSD